MTQPVASIGGQPALVIELSGNPLPNGTVIGLVWDGTTYQPANRQADTSAQKFFTGPVPPQTLPGVVLQPRDQWIQTAS